MNEYKAEMKAVLRPENQWHYKYTRTLYMRKRRQRDPAYRLRVQARTRVRNFIWRFLGKPERSKRSSLTLAMGCTKDFLRRHIEGQFKGEMGWHNYGFYWTLDHIKPLAKARTWEELKPLIHWTNLQPLHWLDNIRKGDKEPHPW